MSEADAPADTILRAAPVVVLGLLSGALDPAAAASSGALRVEGDAAALRELPALSISASLRPDPSPCRPISSTPLDDQETCMSIIIHGANASPFVRKVRVALIEKGIHYQLSR